jgi:hypothetical protein
MDSLGLERTLSECSIVVAAADQISADLAGEAVILDLKSGTYFGVDAVGARIWALIQEPRTMADLRDALLAEYEVDPDRCEGEVLAFIHEMVDRGLVEVRDAVNA